MITPDDVCFHLPAGVDHTWAETNFFGFYVPERNLCGNVYVVARKTLGSTFADISLFDRVSLDRKDCLLVDSQQHLPAPEITYKGAGGTRLDLRFEALMEPFDLHGDDQPAGGECIRHRGAHRAL